MIKIEVDIDLVVVDIDLFVADIDFVVSLNETEDIRLVDVIVSFFEVVIMLKLTFDVICWIDVVLNSVAKKKKKLNYTENLKI